MAGPSISLRDHWKEQRLFLSRIILAAVIVVMLTGVLIARLAQLQVVDRDRMWALSENNRLHIEPLAPTRGLILDRNGIVLADNIPAWQLVAVPEQIDDLETTLLELEGHRLLDSPEHERIIELVRSHRGFERVVIANLDEVEAARFAVRRHLFKGVDIQEGLVRTYVYNEAFAHAVGYVSSIDTADLKILDRENYSATSYIGKTGVERSYEDALHGQVGYRQQVVNAQGRILLDPAIDAMAGDTEGSEFGSVETLWPVPGEDVVLSLDLRLQLAAIDAMAGLKGAVVALDPNSGDVLAMVSMPTFDPNRIASGLSRDDLVALDTDPDRPLFNRAITGRYPPGSTVKPFLGLAGLYHEAIDPDEEVWCGGHYSLPGHTHRYRDWNYDTGGHGNMTLHSAIVQSCNVYYYRLAHELEIDRMEQFMRAFGFGAPTGIDIPGERAGVVPSRAWKVENFSRREDQVWFPGETVIAGIGQGYTLVTPIQIAHAGAALATRGVRHPSRLRVGRRDSIEGVFEEFEPRLLEGVDNVHAEDWQIITDAMVGVTTEARGSGYRVMNGADYVVAGKTGTPQVFSVGQDEEYDEDEVSDDRRDHGIFFGFAPADDPQIVIAVVVENGGGSKAAVPVARAIFDDYFSIEPYVARQH